MYGGCDAFYFEFCSNTAALLELLQNDLKSIINFGESLQKINLGKTHALLMLQRFEVIINER